MPIGMLGFGLNLITGLLFYMGALQHYVHNKTFYWKIVFVVLGGLNLLYFMLHDDVWAVGAGDDAPLSSKIAGCFASWHRTSWWPALRRSACSIWAH